MCARNMHTRNYYPFFLPFFGLQSYMVFFFLTIPKNMYSNDGSKRLFCFFCFAYYKEMIIFATSYDLNSFFEAYIIISYDICFNFLYTF